MSSFSRDMSTKAGGIRGFRQDDDHGDRRGGPSGVTEPKGLVRRGMFWIAIGLALIYAWFAARTTPFTTGANVMTALPLLLAALGAVWLGHVSRSQRKVGPSRPRPPGRNLWPWWVSIGLVGAWELFCYFQLPRFAHPTFSSLYDSASRWQPLKAALFFGWLALGWAIVRAYRRVRA